MGVSATVRTSTNPEKGAWYGRNEAPGAASFWSDSSELVQLTQTRSQIHQPIVELSNKKDVLDVAGAN